ncbi:MAG: pseudouridine synthase [Akkermansiaceae bacterium]
MRLDRLVGKWLGAGKKRTREAFEAGEVQLNGKVIFKGDLQVGHFDRVEYRGRPVQDRIRRVVMMNKPSGVVSATKDEEHRTVLDMIAEPWAKELHLAGRLDRFTTGLMILTNDSRVSESLTEPGRKVGKRYRVEVDGEIGDRVVEEFERGMWFAKEGVMTAPAVVEMLDLRSCRLTIYEGKHHQVKRMFARFELKVTSLHREAIGEIELPGDLGPGEWRELRAVGA